MRTYRIGQIVPSSNTTMETEIPAMLRAREALEPERFSFHSARMRMMKVTADELARMDAESGHGLITDVSIKRKVRNFVGLVKGQDQCEPAPGEKRFEIYVREKAILNLQHQRAYAALKLDAVAAPAEDQP